jgi:exopolysaccharide biosynthesis WecB/TagA/CpsF family protein/anti-anti-sigma factor
MTQTVTQRPSYAHPPLAILGVPFDNVTTAETIATIDDMIASRQPHYLVTANVDFLVQAQEDVELRRILFDAHLVLCDGTPLVWASRLLGNPLLERVAGADLVPLLLRVAAEKGYRVFFLGATPESVQQAIDNLKKIHPTLIIADYYSPPFNKLLEMDHDEIKRRIVEAKPDLLFVSFGCPKQEKWIAMHYRSLGVPVSAGVGATIDFLAGMVKRAPLWMQRVGMEWIYRLAQEPRRLFKRYFKDLWVFGWKILGQLWQLQLRKSRARTRIAGQKISPTQNWIKPAITESQGPSQSFHLPMNLEASSPQPNDSLAPARSALGGPPPPADSFRCFPSNSSSPLGEERETEPSAVSRFMGSMRAPYFPGTLSPGERPGLMRNEARTISTSFTVTKDNISLIKLPEYLDLAAAANGALPIDELLAKDKHCLLDMSHVQFIDSTGMGLLIRLQKNIRATGHQLVLLTPTVAVRRALALMQLQDFFATAPDISSARELIAARAREENKAVRLRTPAAPNPLLWQGEITAANAAEVWDTTETHLTSRQRRELVIDMSGVRFMDSTGLGMMVRARKLAQRERVKLEFVHLQPAVQNVVHLARLDEFLLARNIDEPTTKPTTAPQETRQLFRVSPEPAKQLAE